MAGSPLRAAFAAIDALDAGQIDTLFAPHGELLRTDGRTAEGRGAIRTCLAEFCSPLHRVVHELTSEWQPEPDVWIAELTATYSLRDGTELGPLYRAAVLRDGPEGIVSLHLYGAHEPSLAAAERGYREIRTPSGHWLPTL